MTGRTPPLRPAGRSLTHVAALAVVAVLAAPGLLAPAPHGHESPRPTADGQRDWREVLRRMADSVRRLDYAGEALWVNWAGGEPRVALSQVLNRSPGRLTVSGVRPGEALVASGGVLGEASGWMAPLPPLGLGAAEQDLRLLEGKYRVEVSDDRVLDRPCVRVGIRRHDGLLRERLWVDEDNGLLLRRETYEGDAGLLRLAAYLSLDPAPEREAVERPSRPHPGPPSREHGGKPVRARGVEALREAGWTIPERLPEGYRRTAAYVLSAADRQPLQIVYSDGLYAVSLFQQRGRPDWEALPPGAKAAPDLEHAYEWPAAVPQRMVWEASGTTYILVGDAPPSELSAIAAALPGPERPNLLERLRRGLGRLWSAVSPWG